MNQENEKPKITYVRDVPLDNDGEKSESRIKENAEIFFEQKYGPLSENRRKKKRRKLSPRFFIAVLLMAGAITVGALIYRLTSKNSKNSENFSESESYAESQTVSDGTSQDSDSSSESDVSAADEDNDTAFPSYLKAPEGYDYSSPVPASAEQTDEWFSDAVFVGNSRTQGLLLYTGLNATALADVGLTVETVETSASFSNPEGGEEKITAVDALSKLDYNKVYLMFGINELGWAHEDVFFSKYASLIQTIRESHPDVQIYIQSILPVTESKITGKDYLTNTRIDSFNEQLLELAEQEQVYYLDVASAVAGEDGSLPDDMSSDGVHLKQEGCGKWKNYLLSHCVLNGNSPTQSENAEKSADENGYSAIQIPNVSAEDSSSS